MIPEIALTSQLVFRFKEVFGSKVIVYHSMIFRDLKTSNLQNYMISMLFFLNHGRWKNTSICNSKCIQQAGAVSSIAVGISENTDYRDELSIEQDPTLGTTNLTTNFRVKTILDFWGSKKAVDAITVIYSKNLYSINNPSLFIAHGTKDRVVTYREAEELSEVYLNMGANYKLYPLVGKGHGAWNYSKNNKSLRDLALEFIITEQRLELN